MSVYKQVGGNIIEMNHEVFNNNIGAALDFGYPNYTEDQKRIILAELFEQLMLFDKIIISTNRVNYPLFFLIDQLGINKVEEFIENDFIKFLIWTPFIISPSGQRREDGTNDESEMYGKPPIAAGSLVDKDFDPENNIDVALSKFSLHRDRKRIFKRVASKNYIIPNGMEFSSNSAKIIIEAYKSNNLSDLGLPYSKEPEQLNLQERQTLLNLGYKILETAVLSQYGLKSYNNYEHYKICSKNIENIGKAYQVSENASQILKFENLPDLKSLFLKENITFESVSKLRYLSSAKYFRKWLNTASQSADMYEITKEYNAEIRGVNKFINTQEGKLIKNISVFGISTALGSAIAGNAGLLAGFGFGILEDFWLDSILKGKNPSMFIDDLRKELI